MKLTTNQLRLELADIQSSHLQLNTFFWGDFARAVNEESINYPLMCSYFPSAGFLNNQTTLPLTIVIADKTYSDFSNLNDVESDCLQTCRDIFNIMNKSTRWQKIGRVDSCSLTKFIESEADVCAGYVMTVNFVLRDSNSICDLPLSGYDFDQDIASSCLPVQIFRNGVLVDTIPSGGMYSYTSNDFTYIIRNTETVLYSGTVTANIDITIQDSTISNSDATYTNSIVAEGSLTLPDITVNVENSALIVVNSGVFPSVKDVTISAPGGHVHIKKANDGSIVNQAVASGDSIIYSVADSTAVVKNSAGTTLATDTIHATESKDITIPNITFTDSDGISSSVPAGINITATACSAPTYNSARLIKTGQTISYRTGDDGDIEAGRPTSFTLLESNNPFGTVRRFTDEFGGLTFANNIVIDWSTYDGSTVLGYRRTLSASAVSWNDAIDGALAVSIGSFTTGWRLTNIRELMNLMNFQNGNGSYTDLLQYSPFNITGSLWSSTSLQTYGNVFAWQLTSTNIVYAGNATLTKYIPCRTFTVTGTTLS